MSYLGIFGSAFVVGLSGAMMPGSLLVVNITETSRRGFWAGPMVVAGHAALELILVVCFVLGLNRFFAHPTVAGLVGVIGGGMLAWLGYGIIRAVLRGEVSLQVGGTENPTKSSGPLGPGYAGMVASISNPYWLLWWSTIGVGYVLFSWQQGFPGLVSFYTGHISADFAWYTLVSLAVTTGRRFLTDTVYRGVLGVCGVFLVGLAAYFVYTGAGFLLG